MAGMIEQKDDLVLVEYPDHSIHMKRDDGKGGLVHVAALGRFVPGNKFRTKILRMEGGFTDTAKVMMAIVQTGMPPGVEFFTEPAFRKYMEEKTQLVFHAYQEAMPRMGLRGEIQWSRIQRLTKIYLNLSGSTKPSEIQALEEKLADAGLTIDKFYTDNNRAGITTFEIHLAKEVEVGEK